MNVFPPISTATASNIDIKTYIFPIISLIYKKAQ